MKLKPNKLYSRHLDDEFLKNREAKTSPWRFLINNYKLSIHFIERCEKRKIAPKSVVDTLRLGKKYYYFEEEKLITKHVHDKWVVVEDEGILVTALFFSSNLECIDFFIFNRETFIFDQE